MFQILLLLLGNVTPWNAPSLAGKVHRDSCSTTLDPQRRPYPSRLTTSSLVRFFTSDDQLICLSLLPFTSSTFLFCFFFLVLRRLRCLFVVVWGESAALVRVEALTMLPGQLLEAIEKKTTKLLDIVFLFISSIDSTLPFSRFAARGVVFFCA